MVTETLDWYDRLSPKEREVLEAYAQFHSYEAVARRLRKSESSVDQQLLSARRKMGVVSTAEAMYLLAERRARIAGTNTMPVAEGSVQRHVPARRRSLLARAAVGVLLVSTIIAGLLNYSSSASPAELRAQITRLRSPTGGTLVSEQDAARRSALVAELCDRAWAEMWGPGEDAVMNAMSDVAPDIRAAFNWSATHDPDTAVRIIGNGHRVFNRLTALSDWQDMADRAVALQRAEHGVWYARALCGVAFAHWMDDRVRAYKAANQAFLIFRATPGYGWDEANALRHMGLCCVPNRAAAFAFYGRALNIYQGLRDRRGLAMTQLSFGQASFGEGASELPDIAERVNWEATAADGFRSLRNRNMLDEAIAEIDRRILDPKWDDRYLAVRAKGRAELLTSANECFHEHSMMSGITFAVHCLQVDCQMRLDANVKEDLELIWSAQYDLSLNQVALNRLTGYYQSLCRKIGRHGVKIPKADADIPEVTRGTSMTVQQMLDAAAHLTSSARSYR
jgi:DNA-binding CsgD family transcriptional regulator